jgi:hypothetical protein
MLLPGVVLRESPVHGRGLFATLAIPPGTVVWHPCKGCPAWSAGEMQRLPRSEWARLDEHGYWLCDGGLLLPCRDACWMNHSCAAAVLDFGLDFGVAVRGIPAGAEVTCDYGSFASDPWWTIPCRCGAAGCRRRISSQDGLRADVRAQWQAVLEAVLPLVGAIPQPLRESLSECSPVYRALRDGRAVCLAASASIRRPAFRDGSDGRGE